MPKINDDYYRNLEEFGLQKDTFKYPPKPKPLKQNKLGDYNEVDKDKKPK